MLINQVCSAGMRGFEPASKLFEHRSFELLPLGILQLLPPLLLLSCTLTAALRLPLQLKDRLHQRE